MRSTESTEVLEGVVNFHDRDVISVSRSIIKEQILLIEELSGPGSNALPKLSYGPSIFDANIITNARVRDVELQSDSSDPPYLGIMHCFGARASDIIDSLEANEGTLSGVPAPSWEQCLQELEDISGRALSRVTSRTKEGKHEYGKRLHSSNVIN